MRKKHSSCKLKMTHITRTCFHYITAHVACQFALVDCMHVWYCLSYHDNCIRVCQFILQKMTCNTYALKMILWQVIKILHSRMWKSVFTQKIVMIMFVEMGRQTWKLGLTKPGKVYPNLLPKVIPVKKIRIVRIVYIYQYTWVSNL